MDALRRARAAQRRVDWDRSAALGGDDVPHELVGDGDRLRPAPPPVEVGGVLDRLVEDRGWGERLRGASLDARWPEVVGEELARRCRPGRLAGGVLVVVVDSPRWATQLRYLERTVLRRVGEALGLPVEQLRVVVGDVDAR